MPEDVTYKTVYEDLAGRWHASMDEAVSANKVIKLNRLAEGTIGEHFSPRWIVENANEILKILDPDGMWKYRQNILTPTPEVVQPPSPVDHSDDDTPF